MVELFHAIDPLQAIAGLGLFLFAMLQLEQALEALLGSTFKRSLRRYSEKPPQAIAIGVISTAILQSSSLVGVMTLALVGSGVIALSNGIGIILGANLGTTLTGWLVTLIGFKLPLEQVALPLVAVGAIGYMVLRRWPYAAESLRLVLALGLLIWALNLMKAAVSPPPELEQWLAQGQHWYGFFFLGLVVTLIIQSSSAMMMITLSLLAATAIDITQAAAVVVGADLGTTGTVMLGAIGGSASRRQVAFGHLWFNVINAVLALLLLPILPWLIAVLGISDPLIALVGFHSTFNLLGLLLFYPLLNPFARFLQGSVGGQQQSLLLYLNREAVAVPETGSEALHREAEHLLMMTLARFQRGFAGHRQVRSLPGHMPGQGIIRYDHLKRMEAEILNGAGLLQKCSLTVDQARRLQDDLGVVRNAVHAAKCMKDIQHNIDALQQTQETLLQQLWGTIRSNALSFLQPLNDRDPSANPAEIINLDLLLGLTRDVVAAHDRLHQQIVQIDLRSDDPEVQLPSLLNLNRELYAAQSNLIMALGMLYLSVDDQEQLRQRMTRF
ncbi:MAG: hypothetical protein Tsb002_20440 [Wenzhouxiangellaceae bacterium]